jgi:hypothetical protein
MLFLSGLGIHFKVIHQTKHESLGDQRTTLLLGALFKINHLQLLQANYSLDNSTISENCRRNILDMMG